MVLAFLISFKIPLNQPFRLLFVLPAFYILIAVGINNSGRYKNLLMSIVVMISVFGLTNYYLDPKFWREDWKGATHFVNNKVNDNSLVAFAWSEPFPPYIWYKGKNGVGIVNKFPATKEEVTGNLNLDNKTEVYLFEYLQELSDPNKYTQEVLSENGFKLIKTTDFNGVGFVGQYRR